MALSHHEHVELRSVCDTVHTLKGFTVFHLLVKLCSLHRSQALGELTVTTSQKHELCTPLVLVMGKSEDEEAILTEGKCKDAVFLHVVPPFSHIHVELLSR